MYNVPLQKSIIGWAFPNSLNVVSVALVSNISKTVMTITSKTLFLSNATETSEKSDAGAFFWSYTEEPHKTRRQAIIKAHPEV